MYLEVDHQRVFAYTGGKDPDPARPTLLFVHGAGTDHTVWALQSRYFAHHGWNVLAPDLPGHGRSAGAAAGEVGTMAGWLARLLDAAGVRRAAFVGHSMGALVVLEAAAQDPERASAVALLGASVPMPVSDALLAAAAADDHAAFDMINLWGHSGGAQLGGNPNPGMWMTGGALRLLERSAPGVLHADLAACHAYAGGAASARRLRCPVLLVLGTRDLMTPVRAAQALIEALPGVRVRTLEGCGHMMTTERPDEVLDALAAFLGAGPAPRRYD